jgi:putative glutamine amidotransferase
MGRPRIGITTYHRTGEDRLAFSLPAAYVDAVRLAGGVPLLLPPGEERPEELLAAVDGIVFGGGGDLDPSLFDGERHHTNYSMCVERDAFELGLMRAALERRVPTLGICRGMQVLNVVLGGDLHAHLPDVVGEEIAHRVDRSAHTHHPVRVEAGSRLAGVLGETQVVVASWHHQGVRRLGAGLRPVAWAGDGTVEALELERAPQVQAVQWHPELQAETGSPQLRLFRELVARAGGRQNPA